MLRMDCTIRTMRSDEIEIAIEFAAPAAQKCFARRRKDATVVGAQ